MGLKKEDWGDVLNYLQLAEITLANIPKELDDADDETIVDLLRQSMTMDQKTWVLQSFILYYKYEQASKNKKTQAIKEVAESINMSKSAAFDLLKIYKYILNYDMDIARLPYLNKNHFITIIRNLDTIESNNQDVLELLKKANDDVMTAVQLNNFIKKIETKPTEHVWYKIESSTKDEPNLEWEDEPVQLYRNVMMYKSGDSTYLKIKQHSDD